MSDSEAQAVNIRIFPKIVKKYTELTALTPQRLHEFVDKIVVPEADKSSDHRIQRMDIHYIFIGEVDFFPGISQLTVKRSNSMTLLHQAVTSIQNIRMLFMRGNP